MRLNHIVAILAILLASCVALLMYKFGFPDKIVVGMAVISILFVAIVWSTSCIIMGGFSEDEE